jgi:hypothetical protein
MERAPEQRNVKRFYWQDLAWLALLGVVLVLMLVPPMADWYQAFNADAPYLSAFLKFMLMAPMGELLASRLRQGVWTKPPHLAGRAVVWGFLGMVIALAFVLFQGGVRAASQTGLLPAAMPPLLTAFVTSVLINVLFAPGMMAFHRLSDAYFDLRGEGYGKPTIQAIAQRIHWGSFLGVVVGKTIPLFWIPAHTITFLLPAGYRVLMAALLSIALGLIMALVKPK